MLTMGYNITNAKCVCNLKIKQVGMEIKKTFYENILQKIVLTEQNSCRISDNSVNRQHLK